MNLIVSALSFLAAIVVAVSQDNEPALGSFDLENLGTIREHMTSGNVLQITLPFRASNRVHGSDVLSKDCVTPFEDDLFDVNTSEPHSLGQGFIQFDTIVNMHVDAIKETKHWNDLPEGSLKGWVILCVQTFIGGVGLDDAVDFKENLINVTVSMTATFGEGENKLSIIGT